MSEEKVLHPTTIIIFGATGDLAKRKLFPAFYNLYIDGRMPEQFNIVALGRSENTNKNFRNYVVENLENFSRRKGTPKDWSGFKSHITYFQHQLDQEDSYQALNQKLEDLDNTYGTRGNRLFYLSIAPNFITTISNHIKNASLASDPAKDRIIIEKPFGHDKQSAIELNNLLGETFEEEQIYRIDHYLGKETVQNILAFRFGNSIYEPLWNHNYIESVQITVAEEVGVETRGAFYEQTGALIDMVQNHLLQILCMVAMEPPASLESGEIRDRKVDVLKSIRRILPDQVSHYAVRGQYGPGIIDGVESKGYRQENGIAPDSNTETFAAVKFYLDNERWQDVPFYVRTGKKMKEKHSYITIQFKPLPHSTFSNSSHHLSANRLIINIQPMMDIRLQFMTKKPGLSLVLEPVEMIFDNFACQEDTPEAYETLLLEALLGDLTLFMRSDQVEEAWDVVKTIQESWKNNKDASFPNYAAGSWGPEDSMELVKRQGHKWV
ncbi:glucose-6-phosphate dehydrogenase [Elizabethkingia anophelis]|uniref:glucose-6-phosphate dehydrogenase n=1 Tax=Elizabethkingia anophelis TaxID=1117645 RepID=UPI00077E4A33|nr:glucose-6-phosphate dehydrogenase [Elizabethkingia anophelis]AMR41176.1 glucose-6-phosphate dehydrogenase [Elizabethkingia anophelis]AMX47816.1 glucose-6-phosphate dehydrogenase [Elizabethkingia anophelis]AMX51273.1 glucose-6-phosphate dehydrogenase [Elizabethkingia anophelis]AMX54668.1 glucose-6-phosphate dehydrogenase [Elizabethkingia anophelis]EGT4346438.1 glucose-6-phosphate dehydrogenase [Elizabethkingia anophelis]